MAKAGKKYPLLIYTRMIDRWWPAVLLLGLSLIALAWPLYQNLFFRIGQPWRWQGMAGVGGIITLIAFVMLLFRKGAYVQLFGDHMKLVTPFLHLNISYRRILRTTTASMYALFPPKSISGWRREIIEPLSKMTAVVIELNSFPIPPEVMRFFLSPFFFKDKTPHFVLLVQNWMGFSSELESLRVTEYEPAGQRIANRSILTHMPRK